MDSAPRQARCHDCHLYRLACPEAAAAPAECGRFVARGEGFRREVADIDRVVQVDKMLIAALGCVAAAGILWTELFG